MGRGLARLNKHERKTATGFSGWCAGPLLAWQRAEIDGVVSAGPHECMPNKIAESQFFHVTEGEGLPTLTLPLNGEPMDAAVLDNFAFEVKARFNQKTQARPAERRRQTAPVAAG